MHLKCSQFQKIIASRIPCTSDAQDSITRGKVEFSLMVPCRNFMGEFERQQGIKDCAVLFLHQVVELGIRLKISGSPLIAAKHFVKCCLIIAKRGMDFPKLHWSNCHDALSLSIRTRQVVNMCEVLPRLAHLVAVYGFSYTRADNISSQR